VEAVAVARRRPRHPRLRLRQIQQHQQLRSRLEIRVCSPVSAPIVSAETSSVCTVIASDAAGNEASESISFTINPDVTNPEASFSPETLSVEANMTASSVLTVSDNVAVAGAATVICTNGGSFDVSSNVFTAADVSTETESV